MFAAGTVQAARPAAVVPAHVPGSGSAPQNDTAAYNPDATPQPQSAAGQTAQGEQDYAQGYYAEDGTFVPTDGQEYAQGYYLEDGSFVTADGTTYTPEEVAAYSQQAYTEGDAAAAVGDTPAATGDGATMVEGEEYTEESEDEAVRAPGDGSDAAGDSGLEESGEDDLDSDEEFDADALEANVAAALAEAEAFTGAEGERVPLALIQEEEGYFGVVTRTNDSGAFVDIGATVEGFVNASELSLDFVERVDEAVSVGDEVRVVVIDVDLGQAQLELSIAEAMEADLDAEEAAEEEAEERARAERAAAKDGEDADSDEDDYDDDERGEGQPELTVGEQVTVTVRRMLDFGAFCALEGGYEVLLPVGEMGLEDEDEEDMEDKFEEGQELVARVLSIRGPQVAVTLTKDALYEGGAKPGAEGDPNAAPSAVAEFDTDDTGSTSALGGVYKTLGRKRKDGVAEGPEMVFPPGQSEFARPRPVMPDARMQPGKGLQDNALAARRNKMALWDEYRRNLRNVRDHLTGMPEEAAARGSIVACAVQGDPRDRAALEADPDSSDPRENLVLVIDESALPPALAPLAERRPAGAEWEAVYDDEEEEFDESGDRYEYVDATEDGELPELEYEGEAQERREAREARRKAREEERAQRQAARDAAVAAAAQGDSTDHVDAAAAAAAQGNQSASQAEVNTLEEQSPGVAQGDPTDHVNAASAAAAQGSQSASQAEVNTLEEQSPGVAQGDSTDHVNAASAAAAQGSQSASQAEVNTLEEQSPGVAQGDPTDHVDAAAAAAAQGNQSASEAQTAAVEEQSPAAAPAAAQGGSPDHVEAAAAAAAQGQQAASQAEVNVLEEQSPAVAQGDPTDHVDAAAAAAAQGNQSASQAQVTTLEEQSPGVAQGDPTDHLDAASAAAAQGNQAASQAETTTLQDETPPIAQQAAAVAAPPEPTPEQPAEAEQPPPAPAPAAATQAPPAAVSPQAEPAAPEQPEPPTPVPAGVAMPPPAAIAPGADPAMVVPEPAAPPPATEAPPAPEEIPGIAQAANPDGRPAGGAPPTQEELPAAAVAQKEPSAQAAAPEKPSLGEGPAISAATVKDLRAASGAGMMDCKKALVECNGDYDAAVVFLRNKGLASADKKGSRVAAEGLVVSYIHAGSRLGVLAEVNCETDFVARGAQFREFAEDVAMQAAANMDVAVVSPDDVSAEVLARERELEMAKEDLASKPEAIRGKIVQGRLDKFRDTQALLPQPFIRSEEGKSVEQVRKELVASLGENISIRRFTRFALGEGLAKKSDDFAAEVAAQTEKKESAPAKPEAPKEAAAEPEAPQVAVSAKTVKELRAMSSAGMMDCKKALAANNNDLEAAAAWLKKKGLASAGKKAGRIAAEGVVQAYVHQGDKIGVLIEVNSESDFVAKNEAFVELAEDMAMQVASNPEIKYVSVEDIPQAARDEELAAELQKEDLQSKPENIRPKIAQGRVDKTLGRACLLNQDYIKDPTKTVETVVKEAIASLGENIRVRRFVRYDLGEGIEKRSDDFAAEVAAQTGQA